MLPTASIKMNIKIFTLQLFCILVFVISAQCEDGGILKELNGLSNAARNGIEDNAVHRSRKLLSIPILNNRTQELLPKDRANASLRYNRRKKRKHRGNKGSKKKVNIYIIDGKPPKIKDVDTSDSSDYDHHRDRKRRRTTTRRGRTTRSRRRHTTRSRRTRTTRSRRTRTTRSRRTRRTKSRRPHSTESEESRPTESGELRPIDSEKPRTTQDTEHRTTRWYPGKIVQIFTEKSTKTHDKDDALDGTFYETSSYNPKTTADPDNPEYPKPPVDNNRPNFPDSTEKNENDYDYLPDLINHPNFPDTSERNENNFSKPPVDNNRPDFPDTADGNENNYPKTTSDYNRPDYPEFTERNENNYSKPTTGFTHSYFSDSSERNENNYPKPSSDNNRPDYPDFTERNENNYPKPSSDYNRPDYPDFTERNENNYHKPTTGFTHAYLSDSSERNEYNSPKTPANIFDPEFPENIGINKNPEDNEIDAEFNENDKNKENFDTKMPIDDWFTVSTTTIPKAEKPSLDNIYKDEPEENSDEIDSYQKQLLEASSRSWYVTPHMAGKKLKLVNFKYNGTNPSTKKLPSTRCSTDKALPKLDPHFNPSSGEVADISEDPKVLHQKKNKTYSYIPPGPPRIPKHYIDDE